MEKVLGKRFRFIFNGHGHKEGSHVFQVHYLEFTEITVRQGDRGVASFLISNDWYSIRRRGQLLPYFSNIFSSSFIYSNVEESTTSTFRM